MWWISLTSNPALSLVRPPGPNAEILLLCVNSDNGFVWSMNCDNWELPKNSLIDDVIGFVLINVCGVTTSRSCVVILSRTALSNLVRPILNWFCSNSPTHLIRLFPKWSISSISPNPWSKPNK